MPGTRKVGESTASTTSELFFDLVFVFAFVQVTNLMTKDFTARGVADGMLVLTLLWWAWSISVWISNRVRADYGVTRATVLAVSTILFLLAEATVEAFTDIPGGLNGPVVFVACYFAVRTIFLVLRWYAVAEMTRQELMVLIVPWLGGSALLLAAALAPQRLLHTSWQIGAAKTGLWVAAIAVDFGLGMGLPVRRRILSARHWAERHGLIVLVALGESLIAIGITSVDLPISRWLIWASLLGVGVAVALEWLYFDVVALAGEQSLRDCPPVRRVNLARDGYTFLHLPMVAGIILYALGLKKMIASLRHSATGPVTHFEGLELYVLYGGVALFLISHVAFQLRITKICRTIIWPRIAVVVLLIALIPVMNGARALYVLGLLAACCVALVVVEVIIADGQRKILREEALMGRANEETEMGIGWSHPSQQ